MPAELMQPEFEINETERGNIYLAHVEENWHNAWIRVAGDDRWLQISIRPCNYPALDVSTVTITDEDLAKHIREQFGGGLWIALKMNIEGVEVADGFVVGDDNDL